MNKREQAVYMTFNQEKKDHWGRKTRFHTSFSVKRQNLRMYLISAFQLRSSRCTKALCCFVKISQQEKWWLLGSRLCLNILGWRQTWSFMASTDDLCVYCKQLVASLHYGSETVTTCPAVPAGLQPRISLWAVIPPATASVDLEQRGQLGFCNAPVPESGKITAESK